MSMYERALVHLFVYGLLFAAATTLCCCGGLCAGA